MKRSAIMYGLCLAAGAFVLRWLQYQHTVRLFSTEIYVALIAVTFAVLGLWLGQRLTRSKAPAAFEKNKNALEYLGVSGREYEVLSLLATGLSNREIAERLFRCAPAFVPVPRTGAGRASMRILTIRRTNF